MLRYPLAPIRRALVLAAGKGTRISPVAPDRPKPLIVIGGTTILERHLRSLSQAGVEEVWINLHHLGRQIVAHVGDGAQFGLRVHYSWEPELLGTAGAAKELESELGGERFYVVYGDNLLALNYRAMATRHIQVDAAVTIAIFDRDLVPNTGLAGGRVVLDMHDHVRRFDEGIASASPYVNAGVYVLEPSVLRSVPSGAFTDFGRDVFPSLLARGATVAAYRIDGYCLGIDTPAALDMAEAFLEGRKEVVAS